MDRRLKAGASKTVRVLASVLLVSVITWLDFGVLRVNATTAGFAYVVSVLLIASFVGTVEALVGSVVAVGSFNYFFLPPIFTFTVADPQNWAALFALLTTALVASRLAERAREQTAQVMEKQREMELLYALSRTILLADPGDSMARALTFDLARIFELSSVVLFDAHGGHTFVAGPEDVRSELLDQQLHEAAVRGTSFHNGNESARIFAVRLGGQPIGSLALRGLGISETAQESLLNLVAIALERTRGQERASRAAVERQSEVLKSTLLDAMAHEFKTPLTSIKAAASTLVLNPEAGRDRVHEIGSIVNEEADRLERLVSDAIQMARIEPGKLKMNRRAVRVAEIVEEAMRQSRPALADHAVTVALGDPNGEVYADPELIELALRHLLDNAAKYSGMGSRIEVSTVARKDSLLIEVRDSGPGIPEDQQGRIFEKFYRAPQTSGNAPGTGMGLSIVREIVKAHGGKTWVESGPGEGARFSISLPIAPEAPK